VVHPTIEAARQIAVAAHAGQVDKAGKPYIGHLARVAARIENDPEAIATAWLHDSIEDTELGPEDLRHGGIPEAVIDAVVLLTRVPGQSAQQYYAAVREHPLALLVKIADLDDNSDPGRLAALPPETAERLREKYAAAREALRITLVD
jgi:(p)ppGpp synthase/HD superfamily hydrolase